jgi:3-hydroxyisobutyrate dehydrogenase-like beta-hydroxyacid dehydrogenase
MMRLERIAILSPGDMGNAVGASLRKQGRELLTCLAGRSEATRVRAARAGFADVADLETLARRSDLILSIMPPEAAVATARKVAAAMTAARATPVYADCNAIAPETAREIAAIVSGAGAAFIDGGIIGSPPGRTDQATRIYVSGPQADMLNALTADDIRFVPSGPEIGRASAIKMCYAAITKGTNMLHLAALMTAESLGVGEPLRDELAYSQSGYFNRMKATLPFIPADAARWIGEMTEIIKTFESVGVTPHFHIGAREVYEVLDRTPYAAETRETMDRSRTLEQALKVYLQYLNKPRAAAE